MKKIKPDTLVYIVSKDHEQIYEEIAAYVGTDSFVRKDYPWWRENCQRFSFDDYEKVWFLSLEKAKAHVKKYFKEQRHKKIKFTECNDNCLNKTFWEVSFDE